MAKLSSEQKKATIASGVVPLWEMKKPHFVRENAVDRRFVEAFYPEWINNGEMSCWVHGYQVIDRFKVVQMRLFNIL